MTLITKRVQDGWIVCRKGTEKHSHFRSRKAANNFKSIILRGLMPKSPYYIESAKRVLTSEEFEHLREERKQKYINRGGKVG